MPTANLREIGSAGLEISGGVVLSEWNDTVRRLGANAIYTEMRDNDPVIGAVLSVIEHLLSSLPYHIDKGTGRKAKDAVKFLEDCIKDMDHTWADFIQEALSMLQYGWAYHEIVYKERSDGRLGWKRIPLRAQSSLWQWQVDDHNEISAMIQSDFYLPRGGWLAYIPIETAIHFRTTPFKQNPEGRSILRSAVRPYMFLKRLQEVEAIGIERELAGLPVFFVPPKYLEKGASDAEKAQVALFKRIMGQIRKDERMGLVLPCPDLPSNGGKSGFDFKLMSGGGKNAIDTNTVITRYEGRIATAMLAQFVLLGQGGPGGSYALADKQASIFTIALQAMIDRIYAEINKKLIPDLMELNGYEKNDYPTMRAEEMQDVSLSTIATFINQLCGVSVIEPDDELENAVRKMANLPPKGTPRVPAADAQAIDGSNPLGAGRPAKGAADKNDPNAKKDNEPKGKDAVNVRTEGERRKPK